VIPRSRRCSGLSCCTLPSFGGDPGFSWYFVVCSGRVPSTEAIGGLTGSVTLLVQVWEVFPLISAVPRGSAAPAGAVGEQRCLRCPAVGTRLSGPPARRHGSFCASWVCPGFGSARNHPPVFHPVAGRVSPCRGAVPGLVRVSRGNGIDVPVHACPPCPHLLGGLRGHTVVCTRLFFLIRIFINDTAGKKCSNLGEHVNVLTVVRGVVRAAQVVPGERVMLIARLVWRARRGEGTSPVS